MSLIGKKLSEIKGYEKRAMFVKFLSNKNLDDLLNGKLYMQNLGAFIDLEEKQRKKGQGDRYEAAFVTRGGLTQGFIEGFDEPLFTAQSSEFVMRYEMVRRIPAFCCATFTADDLQVVDENEDNFFVQIKLNEEEKNAFSNDFGDTAVILPGELMDILKEHAIKQQFTWIMGKPIYFDYNIYDPIRYEKFERGDMEIIFWKDIFFKKQKEFRFAITNHEVEKFMYFEIGSLREQTLIFDSKKIFDEFVFAFDKNEII